MKINIEKQEEISTEHLNEREKELLKIINNVLWFSDNSDYGTALWKALYILVPELKNRDIYDACELEHID